MSFLLLIPGCISLYFVLRGRVETAFLSVYLPSLLLLAQDYSVRLPHLPPFSAAEYTLIPIGVVALIRHLKGGSFRLMDVLILLFWVSYLITEILHEPVMNDGLLSAAGMFVSQVLAYVAGRQLIEPDLRFKTVRRFVLFILLIFPIGVYEWRFGQSFYGNIGQRFLGIEGGEYGSGIQLRGGRGRLAASFSGGEFAGIAIGVTFALNAWLAFLNRTGIDLGRWLAKLEKYYIPPLVMAVAIYLTQSRGSMISLGAALTILQIPKFKKIKLATVVVAVLFILGGLGAKQYFTHYLDVDPSLMTEQQSSAAYRQFMNLAYQAVADMGGWFGWASTAPVIEGHKSIDNHFLLTHLIQGELGYILLILIAAESIRTAIANAWSFQALEDRVFACSMIAVFTIFWITYYTIFMGAQMPQFTFLMLGWGQSLVPGTTDTASVAEVQPRSKFVFRRVLT
jgi:hypothetical protein